MFDTLPSSVEYIRADKLRPLAVVDATRSELLPDIPIITDFVPGYEASAMFGVGVPRNTPTEIIDRLNKEINAILVDPKIRRSLPTSVLQLRYRLPSMANSLPKKPISGPR